ncbi:hypothetical protein FSO04_30755 [Paraburkholderia madseniana]|uniref:Uncharacterized protein n=1 Tax=Paraburkholderia madseniana TaxID=2599607 RepID=A0A6N6W871_9BURK|nr:hypothetical protein [Paraburkholderia madseniana]KAE8756088.1 hypothetical protein FSO04_30755 [Paraburkholderia madseniana]
MPLISNSDLVYARRIAASAAGLSRAAIEFRSALKFVLDRADASSSGLAFTIIDSRTDVVLNFGLSTVHGQVEALFDHVLKDNVLLGRYRFFTVEKDATGKGVAEEVWAILFNSNCAATWDTEGDFEWYFGDQDSSTPQMIGTFLLMLLAMLQDKLPRA